MPAVVPALVYVEGSAQRMAVYRVSSTTGDTMDVAAQFKKVTAAAFIGATTQVSVLSLPFTGTVVTLNPVGLAADEAWVMVVGAA